jgi:hypothetical protein
VHRTVWAGPGRLRIGDADANARKMPPQMATTPPDRRNQTYSEHFRRIEPPTSLCVSEHLDRDNNDERLSIATR